MKAVYLARKASGNLKTKLGADFIVVPTIRSLPGFSFKGTESQLKQFVKSKYDREVKVTN